MGIVAKKALKILITGANGLLGQKLVAHCQARNIDFLASASGKNMNPELLDINFASVDITDHDAFRYSLDNYKPTCLVNTAAITNVDLCETIENECFAVNADAVRTMMDWCAKNNAHFIQISTDFIFDGKALHYKEDALPKPLNVYGESKSRAEMIIMNSEFYKWSILRTSLVYGSAHNLKRTNLVLWARGELLRNRAVKIVNDQFRAPTWAADLASAAIKAAEREKYGVFNIVGPECMSMFTFVQRICRFYKQPLELVHQIETKELNQLAKRPVRTDLCIEKARNEINYQPLQLEETLMLLEREIPNHN
jgi:dTDP-4-dehydrorhamnose reductase